MSVLWCSLGYTCSLPAGLLACFFDFFHAEEPENQGLNNAFLTRLIIPQQLKIVWLIGYWVAQVGASFVAALIARATALNGVPKCLYK